ncbi:MAG: endospore coat-associated protein, partial [Paenibacillus sp.]|nr:endospore coat-associated protein [Paenibacillus sp.]
WEVTGCAGRIGPRKSITSNLHGGGQAISMTELLGRRMHSEEKIESIRSSVYELGEEIAKSVEGHFGRLCELGIDIAIDPSGHPWVLELNPKPAREVWLHKQDTASSASMRRKRRRPSARSGPVPGRK